MMDMYINDGRTTEKYTYNDKDTLKCIMEITRSLGWSYYIRYK